MTAILTLATFVGAMFVARRDPFASKFLLVSALLIHAWRGSELVRILWVTSSDGPRGRDDMANLITVGRISALSSSPDLLW